MISIRVPVHSTCAPPLASRLALDSKRGTTSTLPSYQCPRQVCDKDADSLIRSVCLARGLPVTPVAHAATVMPLHESILDYTPHAYLLPPHDNVLKEELMARGPLLFVLGATSSFAHFWSEVAEGKISNKGVFTHSVTSRRHSRVWVTAAVVGWMPRGWRVVVPWVPGGQVVNLEFGCGLELMAIGVGTAPPLNALTLPLRAEVSMVKKMLPRATSVPTVKPPSRRLKMGDGGEWRSTVELGVVWATLVVLCALYLHVVFSRAKK